MRSWSGSFPLWKRTADYRRLTSLRVRPLPLPVLGVRVGDDGWRGQIGTVEVAEMVATSRDAYVRLSGVLHEWPSGEWYVAPDVGKLSTRMGAGELLIEGELIAVSFTSEPVWRGQLPIRLEA